MNAQDDAASTPKPSTARSICASNYFESTETGTEPTLENHRSPSTMASSRSASLESARTADTDVQFDHQVESSVSDGTSRSSSKVFLVIYEVVCNRKNGPHYCNYYWDRPTRETNRNGLTVTSHWRGTDPLPDLSMLVSDKRSFVMIQKVHCSIPYDISISPDRDDQRSMMILSDELLSTVRNVAKYEYNAQQRGEEPPELYLTVNTVGSLNDRQFPLPLEAEIEDPDTFFYHHERELGAACPQTSSGFDHLESLKSYLKHKYANAWENARTSFGKGEVPQRHLKRLFEPNKVLIAKHLGQNVAYVLCEPPRIEEHTLIILNCWSWFPGKSNMERRKTRVVANLKRADIFRIEELEVVPLELARIDDKRGLITRDKKCFSLLRRYACHHVGYTGWNAEQNEYLTGVRLMIDYTTYAQFNLSADGTQVLQAASSIASQFDRRSDRLDVNHEPTDDSLLLLPADLYGFNLTNKEWMHLLVSNIIQIPWNRSAFDRLVLDPRKKELIKALITIRASYTRAIRETGVSSVREDIVAGKGKGMTILLHGGPGTGKTLTAESMAEIAQLPLYRVTCGDVGTKPEDVEQYFKKVFDLGKKWNCVLLLDEADVFLEERSLSDLHRNSLVAVFLRVLEYYDGVLILTSNRVGTFDEAFKSRIQVALHYEDLSRVSRKKIWEIMLDMLEEDGEDARFGEIREHIDELAEHKLNGRAIRNALNTARQLALYKKQKLGWDHIEQVVNVGLEFGEISD